MPDSLNDLPSEVAREVFVAACNYIGMVRMVFDANGVGLRFNELVDPRFKVVKLALGSFDLFL
jgi:hypothetical protein